MSLAFLNSRAQIGLNAPLVRIEVHLAGGLPKLNIVGLPETAVRESKDRVRGAIKESGFDFPGGRITINLAPADLPKHGSRYDLAIALGILVASGQVRADQADRFELVSELALSGELRPVSALLTAALACSRDRRILVVAPDNADEATLVRDLRVAAADNLLQVCAMLNDPEPIRFHPARAVKKQAANGHDLQFVYGQNQAKRALEIAAAGGHSLMLIGPPGTGKTLLANCLPGLLPAMTEAEAIESAAILSLSKQCNPVEVWHKRPFRSPHHSSSAVALVGGGGVPRPGEISLAHHGILFLDEMTEFDRRSLESLREPLESGEIHISRAALSVTYPARFQLVCAMNPCPCGYLGHESERCHCTMEQIHRYRSKISGPLIDRIDVHVEVPTVPIAVLDRIPNVRKAAAGPGSREVKSRVLAARRIQQRRCGRVNAYLSMEQLESFCKLEPDRHAMLTRAMERLHLSLRAYHRILKLARTIADLDGSDEIIEAHLGEAIQYRCLDRDWSGV